MVEAIAGISIGAIIIIAIPKICIYLNKKLNGGGCKKIEAPRRITSIGPSPPIPPPKRRTETINDTTYIFREHWWFQQYPVNDEITLELCVGYGTEWIEGLRPKRESIPYSPPVSLCGCMPLVMSGMNEKVNALEQQIQEVDKKSEQRAALNQICHVPKWRELEMASAQCCCAANIYRTRLEVESCRQSTESRINELRQQIIEQQMQARNAELFNRMVAVAPPPYYPAQPPTHWSILATEQDYLAWKETAYGQRVQ